MSVKLHLATHLQEVTGSIPVLAHFFNYFPILEFTFHRVLHVRVNHESEKAWTVVCIEPNLAGFGVCDLSYLYGSNIPCHEMTWNTGFGIFCEGNYVWADKRWQSEAARIFRKHFQGFF